MLATSMCSMKISKQLILALELNIRKLSISKLVSDEGQLKISKGVKYNLRVLFIDKYESQMQK